MRRLLMMMGVMWFLSFPGLEAQEEPSLTLRFEAVGRVATILHTCPLIMDDGVEKVVGTVGDTISCVLSAVDSAGFPTPVNYAVDVSDPDILEAQVVDSILTVVMVGRGASSALITVAETLQVAVYRHTREPPSMGWGDDLYILEGEVVTLCAYRGTFPNPVAKGHAEGQEVPCPDLGPDPLPTFEISWETSDETILSPWGEGIPVPVPSISVIGRPTTD